MLTTDQMFTIAKTIIFSVKACVFVWGVYCCVWIMMLLRRRSFPSAKAQRQFTDQITDMLNRRAYDEAHQLSASPKNWFRAIPMLTRYLIENRHMPFRKLQHLMAIRMDTEVLSGIEGSIAWVNTCIKAAPMLGLFGTVVGMIGAFGKISGQTSPDATKLGGDIALALNATALGLFIAITLLLLVQFAIVQRRKVEDATVGTMEEIIEHLEQSRTTQNGSLAQGQAVRSR